jgi:hypothetical protein
MPGTLPSYSIISRYRIIAWHIPSLAPQNALQHKGDSPHFMMRRMPGNPIWAWYR